MTASTFATSRVLRRFVAAVCIVVAVVLPGMGCLGEEAPDRDETKVVGARIVTCSGCRLNSLHEVRTFIRGEMRTYPAISITYISGRDPVIEFVNRFNRVVKREELAPFDRRQIHEMVQSHGIMRWTPAPKFEMFPFPPTDVCFAWRQTGGCDPKGEREESEDDDCHAMIDVGRSGFCECSGGRENVVFTCAHIPHTCHDMCAKSPQSYREDAEL